jgi:hypothetical protein
MLKKIGTKVNEGNCLSTQNLRRALAFMRYLPEHNFIRIAEAPHGKKRETAAR